MKPKARPAGAALQASVARILETPHGEEWLRGALAADRSFEAALSHGAALAIRRGLARTFRPTMFVLTNGAGATIIVARDPGERDWMHLVSTGRPGRQGSRVARQQASAAAAAMRAAKRVLAAAVQRARREAKAFRNPGANRSNIWRRVEAAFPDLRLQLGDDGLKRLTALSAVSTLRLEDAAAAVVSDRFPAYSLSYLKKLGREVKVRSHT